MSWARERKKLTGAREEGNKKGKLKRKGEERRRGKNQEQEKEREKREERRKQISALPFLPGN